MFNLFRKKPPAPVSRPSVSTPVLPTSEAGWARHRGTEREHDQRLSVSTLAWLARLPPSLQPKELAASYPRVANRLAICWGDPVLVGRLFDELLVDDRGNRRGFPPAVSQELLALREAHETGAIASGTEDAWDQRHQASADR